MSLTHPLAFVFCFVVASIDSRACSGFFKHRWHNRHFTPATVAKLKEELKGLASVTSYVATSEKGGTVRIIHLNAHFESRLWRIQNEIRELELKLVSREEAGYLDFFKTTCQQAACILGAGVVAGSFYVPMFEFVLSRDYPWYSKILPGAVSFVGGALTGGAVLNMAVLPFATLKQLYNVMTGKRDYFTDKKFQEKFSAAANHAVKNTPRDQEAVIYLAGSFEKGYYSWEGEYYWFQMNGRKELERLGFKREEIR